MTYTATLTGGGWAALRDLTGHDELSVTGTDTLAAIALLDRLTMDVPGAALKPGHVSRLTAADRDRLLATVYQRLYGSRVTSSPACRTCGERYDMAFELPDLLASVQPDAAAVVVAGDGTYQLPDGTNFRLPTGIDELAIMGMPPDQARQTLLARCMLSGAPGSAERIEAAMDAVGPVIDLDLATHCPECSAEQTVHFNLQTYLLAALRGESAIIAGEVHQLARAYGWGLSDILSLTRQQRRTYVNLIEAEATRAQLKKGR